MPKYYKRGALGRMVETEEGVSDPELAEVRLTVEEYRELWVGIYQSKKDAEDARLEAKKQEEIWQQTNRDLMEEKQKAEVDASKQLKEAKQRAEADAQRKIIIAQQFAAESAEEVSSLREQLKQAKTDIQREKNLYRNMMRIMKERANQIRGIKPKKGHDGYVVLESRQWTERYTEEVWDTEEHKKEYDNDKGRRTAIQNGYLRIDHKTVEVWKSTIQTPYNASLSINQVRERIEEEIGVVLKDINVETRLKAEYNGAYHDFGFNDDGYEKNGMYRWKYRANYRAGLWELDIYTTKSLRVPEHRRPPQHIKRTVAGQTKAAIAGTVQTNEISQDQTWYQDDSLL